MTGIILLVVRAALALSIYVFLGWALLTIWQDIRQQKKFSEEQQIPEIRLAIHSGEDIQKHTYKGTEVVIGRDPSCECQLPSETISARHARFSFHHGQWWLEDMKSTNGTILNEDPLFTSVVVVPGDVIQCGDVQINILEE
jgi:pSer/pThr/pTyr-binding forkhead associated (FHA) protein